MSLHVVAIIQVRMGSTRLAGKALKRVLGRPLLDYLTKRVLKASTINKMVIATTENKLDDEIAVFCDEYGYECFRGDENDVLGRFAKAAEKENADAIVRICGDCPLIDYRVIDKIVNYYVSHYPSYDYVSNTLERSYPRGMDTEVFSKQSLFKSAKEATKSSEREHVTPYIYNNIGLFKVASIFQNEDFSNIRLTVDTEEDFTLIAKIIEELYPRNEDFSLKDILCLLKERSDWLKINADIKQKEVLPE